ncbi:MAG: glycosyltransferase, partial [Acidimicrobiales bacterium]
GERTAGQRLPVVVVPPGVDTERFVPIDGDAKRRVRRRLGLPVESRLVVSVSRLVPRKGMDTLVRAAARLRGRVPGLHVAIAGRGRDAPRLRRLITELDAPVSLLGRVPDADLPDLHGCADVFVMLCRTRWGGLEQEGFGIVFLEAAAAGVAQVAGRSGGAHEAVVDAETGFVIDTPDAVDDAADAIEQILVDDALRESMADAARRRVEREFAYDVLAGRLRAAITAMVPT